MTFGSTTIIDKIEILENGVLQIRQAEAITRDGLEITRTFHRWILVPGDDTSNQDARVQAVAAAVWTADVISAYQTQLAAQTSLGN